MRADAKKGRMIVALMLAFVWAAAEPVDLGVVSDSAGVGIETCHEHDRALVEGIPQHGVGGMFVTTNRTLFLRDLSMLPSGTNLLRVRTICQGTTGAVSEVRIVIRRPVAAPSVFRVDLADVPPMPPGMVMPLPNAEAVASYAEFRRRVEAGKRRSE